MACISGGLGMLYQRKWLGIRASLLLAAIGLAAYGVALLLTSATN